MGHGEALVVGGEEVREEGHDVVEALEVLAAGGGLVEVGEEEAAEAVLVLVAAPLLRPDDVDLDLVALFEGEVAGSGGGAGEGRGGRGRRLAGGTRGAGALAVGRVALLALDVPQPQTPPALLRQPPPQQTLLEQQRLEIIGGEPAHLQHFGELLGAQEAVFEDDAHGERHPLHEPSRQPHRRGPPAPLLPDRVNHLPELQLHERLDQVEAGAVAGHRLLHESGRLADVAAHHVVVEDHRFADFERLHFDEGRGGAAAGLVLELEVGRPELVAREEFVGPEVVEQRVADDAEVDGLGRLPGRRALEDAGAERDDQGVGPEDGLLPAVHLRQQRQEGLDDALQEREHLRLETETAVLVLGEQLQSEEVEPEEFEAGEGEVAEEVLGAGGQLEVEDHEVEEDLQAFDGGLVLEGLVDRFDLVDDLVDGAQLEVRGVLHEVVEREVDFEDAVEVAHVSVHSDVGEANAEVADLGLVLVELLAIDPADAVEITRERASRGRRPRRAKGCGRGSG